MIVYEQFEVLGTYLTEPVACRRRVNVAWMDV